MTIVNSRKNVTTFLWFFQHSGRILTPISLITVSQTRLFSKNPSIKAIMNSYLDRYLEKNKKPDAQNRQIIVFQSCSSKISRSKDNYFISRKQVLLSGDNEIITQLSQEKIKSVSFYYSVFIRDLCCHASTHRWCLHNCSNRFKLKMSD